MSEFCKFCGEPLNEEGLCPNGHVFKKMCLNCTSCGKNEDNELVCKNEANLKSAFDKIMAAVQGASQAYSVKNLEIAPLPLKKPTNKCGLWELNNEVLNELIGAFK